MDCDVPDYCDFVCPYAGFPPASTAGLCRTMSAVWCGKLKKLVNKNAPCAWRAQSGRRGKSPSKKAGKKSSRS